MKILGSAISDAANHLSNTKKIKTFLSIILLTTCFSNDYGYDNWIVKTLRFLQIKMISLYYCASGNSLNMIKAAKFCIKKKINFFSITNLINQINLTS